MVISSHEKTIQPGLTYRMMVIVIANVGLATLSTATTNGITSNGISTSLDKKNLTNYEGGIRLCKNTKTMIWKNC
tara:strand:- start:1150 stop:1374 length:225 start_codon:yes stop_codon:yes gene_type:complete